MGDLFKIAVQHVSMALLAALGAAWLVAWAWREHRRACAKLSPGTAAALLAMAFAATMWAQKRSLPSGGNGVPAETAFAPPPGAATNADWLAHGAYEDWFYLRPTNWWARAADGGWIDALRVFSFGGFQARHEDGSWNAYPPPFPQKLSLAPMANWGMLVSHGGTEAQSLFWHCVTESNTLVLTWQDALYARSHTNLVSFQAELFNDGAVAYRYDGSPVATNDFVHPAPTNWNYGVTYAWDDSTVNSNAYYWVEVAAERGPAAISFTGDRESALGDPVVVTRGGETNRVPLLIGIRYAVTSDVPFSVSLAPDNMYATVTTNGPRSAEVTWPLEFSVMPDGNGYRVVASPYDPGCEFLWPTPTRSASCEYSTSSGWIGFDCGDGNCGCGGCSVTGNAMLEDAEFDIPSVWCGCRPENPGDPTGQGWPLTNGPSVSVSFDHSVVFFEEAYTNATNNVVVRRSNRTVLEVSASAGESGGTLHVTAENISKLNRTDGSTIAFPYTAFVPPNGGASFEIEYEALSRSSSAEDIMVTATFAANQGMSPPSQTARLTATQIEIKANNDDLPGAPTSRHIFGVGETVKCNIHPLSGSVSLFSGVDVIWQSGDQVSWTSSMPYVDTDLSIPLLISSGGESFLVALQCLVPHDVVAVSAGPAYCGGRTNKAGYVAMNCSLELHPKTVAFAGHVIIREVPATGMPFDGTHEGYFAAPAHSNSWYHTVAHGAGKWFHIKENNRTIDSDTAVWGKECLPPWSNGYIVWRNPIAWRPVSERDLGDDADRVFCYKPQTFRIDGQGTMRVEKFNHEVHRAVTGDYWCDDVWIEWLSRMEKGE